MGRIKLAYSTIAVKVRALTPLEATTRAQNFADSVGGTLIEVSPMSGGEAEE